MTTPDTTAPDATRQYQREFYDKHFAGRRDLTAEQQAHPLFRSFYDRTADLAYDLATRERDLPAGATVRVLEVGCGEGLLTAALHRRSAARGWQLSYTGTDLSEAGLEHAREVVDEGGQLLLGDAAEVVAGLPSGSADVIIMKNLLHHLDDPAALLAECRRVAGPDGRVVIFEASLQALQFLLFTVLAPRREKYFFAGRRRNLRAIDAAGLRIVERTKFGSFPYELLLATRIGWFRRLLGSSSPRFLQRVSSIDATLTRRLGWFAGYDVWVTAGR